MINPNLRNNQIRSITKTEQPDLSLLNDQFMHIILIAVLKHSIFYLFLSHLQVSLYLT